MKNPYLLFNPASGSYSPRIAERILAALRTAGIDARPLLPGSEAEAVASVRSICLEAHRPLIIAAGGDGTINTVINGMVEQRGTLGVIPLGTANVLARELGITTIPDAVARIAAGGCRPFSVGKVTCSGRSRLFLLMAGIGIDGAIVAGVRAVEKGRLGKVAYLLSAVRQLAAWDRTGITVSSGGRSETCHSVIIANAAHYGGPYIIAPGADIFSPTVEVVPLPLFSRSSFVRFAFALLATGAARPLVARWVTSDGELCISGNKAIQVDGDYFDTGPATISVVPGFNTLCA